MTKLSKISIKKKSNKIDNKSTLSKVRKMNLILLDLYNSKLTKV